MLRSSSRIRQDTAVDGQVVNDQHQLAAWATHSALSITPAAGFNRDRAATSASSDNASTACRHPPASTDPGLGHL